MDTFAANQNQTHGILGDTMTAQYKFKVEMKRFDNTG